MTFQNLANLADIVGVILIVASLIYVARELRQNTEMMRAESRNEIVHSHQQEIFELIEYPESIPIVLSGQKARAWWDFMKPAFDDSFVDHVDGLLENSPLREHFRQYGRSIRAALSSGSVKDQTQ